MTICIVETLKECRKKREEGTCVEKILGKNHCYKCGELISKNNKEET